MRNTNTTIAGGTAQKALLLLGLLALGAIFSHQVYAQTWTQSRTTNKFGSDLSSSSHFTAKEVFQFHVYSNGNGEDGGEFITHSTTAMQEGGETTNFVDGISFFAQKNEVLRLGTGSALFYPEIQTFGSTIEIYNATNNTQDYLRLGHGNSHGYLQWGGDGNLDFRYGAAGTNYNRMTLTQAGFLGISQHNGFLPAANLHIRPTTTRELVLNNDTTGVLVLGAKAGANLAMDENEIMARNNGAIADLHLQTEGGALKIHDGGTAGTQVVVLNNGNVGLGDASTTAKLNAVGVIRASNNAAETKYLEIAHGGSNTYINHMGVGNMDFRYEDDTYMQMTSAGSVGIGGDFNPGARLDVRGTGQFTDKLFIRSTDTTNNAIVFRDNTKTWAMHNNNGNIFWTIQHGSTTGALSETNTEYQWGENNAYIQPTMHLKNALNVAGLATVGTSSNNADLTVHGQARVHELKIDATGTWADYVFADDYQLRPLEEVANYIEEHNHLPDVMSAEEVAEHGYAQTEVNETLLRKIEELTLYMIEMKADNEALKAGNEALARDNAELRGMIEQLQTQEDRN